MPRKKVAPKKAELEEDELKLEEEELELEEEEGLDEEELVTGPEAPVKGKRGRPKGYSPKTGKIESQALSQVGPAPEAVIPVEPPPGLSDALNKSRAYLKTQIDYIIRQLKDLKDNI